MKVKEEESGAEPAEHTVGSGWRNEFENRESGEIAEERT